MDRPLEREPEAWPFTHLKIPSLYFSISLNSSQFNFFRSEVIFYVRSRCVSFAHFELELRDVLHGVLDQTEEQ